ncbi:MAG TPA: TIGR01777 family oxidoreductase [Polyangiaceae bacterium]|nr:TIGR01777 family oxidoreductase [Polyangiaceae bacterium]
MPAKRIVVTGGSGFLGRRLVRRLVARKDLVTVLSRSPQRARALLPENVRVAGYTPSELGPWVDELARTDAVVSLAGEAVVGVRWTDAKKKEFEASRVGASETLVQAFESLPEARRPKVFVGASAVGFYGPRGSDEPVDESTSAGRDYLALLTQKWEAAVSSAAALGIRVVHARVGVVLGKGGGALEKMAKSFRMHVGGPIGNGRQVMSWVHIDDACGLISFAIDNEVAQGPVNLTSPNPVTMDEFAEAIGIILHRKSYLRVPESAVRALFGEGAEPLLTGQRVLPRAAEKWGYEFEYPELLPALEAVLGPE